MAKATSVLLMMTSALAIAGEIARAGELVEVSPAEAENFKRRGKARDATAEEIGAAGLAVELRTDGPTVEEFVTAGYRAENYPPEGYASRSTDEEVLAAIEAQEADDKPADEPAGDDKEKAE